MIQRRKKYYNWLKKDLLNFAKDKPDLRIFIFGSSIIKDHFGDIDIAFDGKITDKDLYALKEHFEESTFPYFVDLINLKQTSKSFKDHILKNKILWIKKN